MRLPGAGQDGLSQLVMRLSKQLQSSCCCHQEDCSCLDKLHQAPSGDVYLRPSQGFLPLLPPSLPAIGVGVGGWGLVLGVGVEFGVGGVVVGVGVGVGGWC